MKILEFMSFNVEWFLTTQGMLITGGVLLLLIALIILSTSGKKGDEEEGVSDSLNPTDNLGLNQNEFIGVSVPEMPAVEPAMVGPQMNQPVQVPEQPVIPEPTNINTGIDEDVSQNDNTVPELNINNVPAVEAQPVLEINPTPVIPSAEPTPVPPTINIPSFEQSTPVVEPEIKPQSEVSIYGGASPVQDIYKPATEPVKPVIYGGADPLENTAPIPKVDIPVQPVQPVQEVKVVEPTIPTQPVTQTAVVDNSVVSTIPATPVAPTIEPVAQVEEMETLEL